VTTTEFKVGDEVRQAGWNRKTYVTLTTRITTKSGRTGWRGWHTEGYYTHLEDGSFTPRRGKQKREETT